MSCFGRKDTFEYYPLQAGNYNLICHWNWIDNGSAPPLIGSRYGSDTIQIHVQNANTIQKINKRKFNIYPNPVRDVLTIENIGQIDNIVKAEIVDFKGQKVLVQELVTNQINVSKISKGAYFLRLISRDNMVFQKKVIIL